MAGMMEGVDQRTTLVGTNRLELLLFRMHGKQRFGVNVFKVREVIKCPKLTRMPRSNPVVRGIANMRGTTIAVLDLAQAIGLPPIEDPDRAFVVLTEFNRTVQGFLVTGVDRIVNMNWEEIVPPPRGTGRHSYMTAVTSVDGELVEIIDVERVLAEIQGVKDDVSENLVERSVPQDTRRVLVIDDSSVARKQIVRTLEQVGLRYEVATNGREGLERLLAILREEPGPITDRIGMVISDIEMPDMDGYTLTKEIKAHPQLQSLYVLLHTSLSGVFNTSMVKKVGADQFVAKFNPDELASAVLEHMGQPVVLPAAVA